MTQEAKRIFRIVAAQYNAVLADFEGNISQIYQGVAEAMALNPPADLVVFPECFFTGYPLGDLVANVGFAQSCKSMIAKLIQGLPKDAPAILLGLPEHTGKVDSESSNQRECIYNALYHIENGEVKNIIRKHHLPDYGVFDDSRVFTKGPVTGPISVGSVRIGACVCEDMWHLDIAETLAETGAEIFVVANGSPYEHDKHDLRIQTMAARAIENSLPLLYVNLLGGQDDLVFDGGSFALNADGTLAAQAPWFESALMVTDWEETDIGWQVLPQAFADPLSALEADYHATVMGLRDYVQKSGFDRVVLGLSGGIDSALVATIATDALGAENVWAVMLPSRYTSDSSLEDATACAAALQVPLIELPITDSVAAVEETLAPLFEGVAADLTEENLQSRMRGLLLMALSNKFGHLLLTTGNKSEVAVGYTTLYGDMCGAYNPLKDMYKTDVFAIAKWRNEYHQPWMLGAQGMVIPPQIISKSPSAELRPDQKDSDSLPEYPLLDAILKKFIEADQGVEEIVAQGYDAKIVARVVKLVKQSEYKRRQSAPGPKLTKRAFWGDRRYPLTSR